MPGGRDDRADGDTPEVSPEGDRPAELQDASLREMPAPDLKDGFDPVDASPEPPPPAPPEPPPLPEPEAVPTGNVYQAAFEQRARLAEARLTEVLDAYRKLKSETEDHRARVTRNLERRFEQRHERLLLKFIEILDNLDRALEAAEGSFAVEPLIQGLILVRTQLLQTLKDEGLERIPVLGTPFDPHVSEAMGSVPVTEPDQENIVIRELLRGYRLNGRVARASRVLIGRFTAPVAEPAEEPAGEAETEPQEPEPTAG